MDKSILELIVEATPTEKDDQVLDMFQNLADDYPFLKSFLFDMLMKVIMHRVDR